MLKPTWLQASWKPACFQYHLLYTQGIRDKKEYFFQSESDHQLFPIREQKYVKNLKQEQDSL